MGGSLSRKMTFFYLIIREVSLIIYVTSVSTIFFFFIFFFYFYIWPITLGVQWTSSEGLRLAILDLTLLKPRFLNSTFNFMFSTYFHICSKIFQYCINNDVHIKMLTLLTGNRFHHVIDLNAGQSENVQKYKSGIQNRD